MQVQEQKMMKPYVKFSTRAEEDRSKLLDEGKYGFKDVHYAHITVAGQKDTVDREVREWLAGLRKHAEDSRIPADWPDHFTRMYDFWKSGLEIPLEGTPIRGWNVIPNSLQETLILLGIMTVEDLANVTDEAVARIGTGGQYLRTKAKAWLNASVDKGKLAEENAALKLKVDTQGEQIATMQKAIEELKALVPQEKKVVEKPLASANF